MSAPPTKTGVEAPIEGELDDTMVLPPISPGGVASAPPSAPPAQRMQKKKKERLRILIGCDIASEIFKGIMAFTEVKQGVDTE